MKLRWKILIAVGVFLLLMAASLTVTMHVQPGREVETYKKMLRDKGEKLEISEVLPPHVPDESNGVALVESAFGLLVPTDYQYSNLPPAMQMVAPGKAMVGGIQTNLVNIGLFGWTNTWENAEADVAFNHPAIELLRKAAGYPAFDFQLDYSKGPEMLLKHLALFKHSAQSLSTEAMCDLHNGDPASAATNICTLLALAQGEHGERVVISQLVRIAMISFATSATWELLQSTNLTDLELLTLQKNWERQEFISGMEDALEMERASTDNTIRTLRTSPEYFNRMMGTSSSGGSSGSGDWQDGFKDFLNDIEAAGGKFMWRTSWTYSDELQTLQGAQMILETMRKVATNNFFNPAYSNMLARCDAMEMTNNPDDWLSNLEISNLRRFFSNMLGGLDRTVSKAMAAEACKRVVVTAIALKRFRLKHGNFPDKFSELTPEFVAVVPLDPVDGQPLRYRRNEDGTYLLYSIGDNGVDDGGDTTPVKLPTTSASNWHWQRARDWVWPQPATPAEVQYYYEHPPK
jgi:hypothetical protein